MMGDRVTLADHTAIDHSVCDGLNISAIDHLTSDLPVACQLGRFVLLCGDGGRIQTTHAIPNLSTSRILGDVKGTHAQYTL